MSRDRLLRLAALAADTSTNENEANSAGRILARLICENPALIADGAAPAPEVEPAHAMDPIVGAVVREAAAAAGDLFRDYFGRKLARESLAAGRCPVCHSAQAPGVRVPLATGSAVVRCVNGHAFILTGAGRSKAGASKPGTRKAKTSRA